ncbi:MAG: exonuclease SbcCD subunit D [Mariniblastus sp.]
MAESVKFIHASDFHLDISMNGLVELPNHLIQVLANAPYEAAQKVFDLAVAERVDFVLLSGDLFDFESSNARAAAFLLAQFERLAQKDIQIYWCAGECDQPDRWPSSIELPDNVVTFSSSIVEQLDHRRDGETVARIMASGFDPQRRNGSDFAAPDGQIFNIALTHGEFESTSLNANHINYWALGGRHKSTKLEKSGCVVVYPGTPQGRTPKESGIHGFKICRVDSSGKLRVQNVESDRVRWMPQKVAISEQVQIDELKNELGERALKIMTDTTDQVVLCKWFLTTEGDFNPKIRKREWKSELLEWLRDEFGRSDRGLWSVVLNVDTPKNLPLEWYEEDTLLGEYMRAMGRYQSDESLKLNLHEYMPQTVNNKVTEGMGQVLDKKREEILRKATLVGVEYLAKHKELSDPVLEL